MITRRRWVQATCAAILLATATAFIASRGDSPDSGNAIAPAKLKGIGALGTLEPRSRIRTVSAPGPAVRIAELLVEEGEDVQAGQVLARTDEHELRQAELQAAQANILVARAQWEQTRTGAKPGDIAAAEAAVVAARGELEQRRIELRRNQELIESRTVAQQDFEQGLLAVTTSSAAFDEAEARLAAITQVREVDIALREAQLRVAEADVAVAEAALSRTVIEAPLAGRILRIHARASEQVPNAGILELGDVLKMHAVAEIYEADVPRVRLGMLATVRVKSTDLVCDPAPVVAIGSLVGRRIALDNDPVTDTDARVVEVRIALAPHDSTRLAGLTNARVEVLLHEEP